MRACDSQALDLRIDRSRSTAPRIESYSHSNINEPLNRLICSVPDSASLILSVTLTVNLSKSSVSADTQATGPSQDQP